MESRDTWFWDIQEEPHFLKFRRNFREIKKMIQDNGHKLISIHMKIKFLSQQMYDILKILSKLHKELTDLKGETS